MIFKTEQALTSFAEDFAKTLKVPSVLELVGDVGSGKTTFTRALARGLGVKEPVTSPSFTISKRYYWSADKNRENTRGATSVRDFELIHYDFYRLEDPGLMASDLEDALSQDNAIVVLEWAESVKNLLPSSHTKITFTVKEDGSRDLKIEEGK